MRHAIESISAQEILDSRGNPTVRVTVRLSSGVEAKAAVPSGASTGKHEALELRDEDKGRFRGLGVMKACDHVNITIARALKGFDVSRQKDIDDELANIDGSGNFRKLGANAVLGVSMAVSRAAAISKGVPLYAYLKEVYNDMSGGGDARYGLPTLCCNIFNGGRHADTNLDFQEIMIIPGGIDSSVSEQVRACSEIFHALGDVLQENGLDTDVGNEGGYAPNIDNTMQAFDLVMSGIEKAGYKAGKQIQLGVDAGASELYDAQRDIYHFGLMDHDMTADQLISLYMDWARDYPLVYLEDGLHDDDWAGWQQLTKEFAEVSRDSLKKKCGRDALIVGDDLFVTQTPRLEVGVDQNVGNAVIAKPNQVGTLTKTMEFISFAQSNDYDVIVSHRSGETSDTYISDLAVAVGSGYIKSGSMSRSDRVEKYNRLMEIERELNK